MNYPYLLKPLKVRGFVLKNRMEVTTALPHFSQGPEKYPSDEVILSYVDHAKNGAAIVTIAGINESTGMPPVMPQDVDVSHFPIFDAYDPHNQTYIVHLTEAIRSMGAIASMQMNPVTGIFPYFNKAGEMELVMANRFGRPPTTEEFQGALGNRNQDEYQVGNEAVLDVDSHPIGDDVPEWVFEKIAESYGQQAAQAKFLGFDMVTVHMGYRAMITGKMISPLTNTRTDAYGGDIYGRSKFPLMVLKSIREAVGPNFIIEFHISGEEPDGGNTSDEVIEFLRMAQEYADIAQIRTGFNGGGGESEGFVKENNKHPELAVTEKIKHAGLDLLICNSGNWHDSDECEAALREGKMDLISMARNYIANPDYGKLVIEGRREDIVPCVQCNRCHGRSENDTFATVCTVNPIWGQERLLTGMTTPVERKKNVAVIGGGPAGMRAAIWLSERGHSVTLYEAKDHLGGAITHTANIDFKWPMRDYRDYLIRQVAKHKIDVHLNARVAGGALQGKYDAVIAALGASPVKPKIPGIDRDAVFPAMELLEHPEKAGARIVVIGGGEIGVETAIFMAQSGKEVTVIEMTGRLATNATKVHYRTTLLHLMESAPNLQTVVNARVTEVDDTGVWYTDHDGAPHHVNADTVVYSVGMVPRYDEAMTYYGEADHFVMIGDCRKVGSVQTATRDAYYAAHNI